MDPANLADSASRLANEAASVANNAAQLAKEAAEAAAQAAVLAYHPVARDHQRHRVGRAGATHRPGSARPAQFHGYLMIGAGFTVRNGPQVFPDLPLEGGGADVQGEVQVRKITG